MDDPDASESLGKADRDLFESAIYPNLGADRADVPLGPTHGVDFGVLDVGGRALVTATDPLSVLPDLGYERAGRFALAFALADVAVSGVAPTHICPSFALPTGVSDDEFAALWTAISDECRELGVAVATGHTARYPGASFPWVGAATVLGVGDHDAVVRPDGARPGDRLLVTKGPAVETAGLLTTLYPEAFDALAESTLREAQACLDRVGVTRDALAAAEAGREATPDGAVGGVTAMHDATEGGLRGALCETAAAAGVRFDVESAAVPEIPAAVAACDALGIDPWACTTSGTLVVAARPAAADAVASALETRGTPVGVVGEVREGAGVYVDGGRVDPPAEDPSWAAYEALSRRTPSG
ncbi:AIR synthase-related protein [Candidatus Halobonum tyrrellensis]|uniref:Hydrogenase maturation factor n=1 Tax=Candidatus Halobonum tyrrellensis G22 TaxID=1324957 RepID=V4J164_9EURY|nr:AIR synthase-related protein [Candidatus Halobonum tyrrellensis]ESP89192.1 hydrogenase maturation factor [Candidatus Halobonum tyrrellensis G22]